jgi:hypothetical protein
MCRTEVKRKRKPLKRSPSLLIGDLSIACRDRPHFLVLSFPRQYFRLSSVGGDPYFGVGLMSLLAHECVLSDRRPAIAAAFNTRGVFQVVLLFVLRTKSNL